MGRTSRWLRSFLGGKKESKNQTPPPPPPAAAASSSKDLAVDDFKKLPKEKRRWSFRRSVKDQAAEPPLAVVEPRPSCLENCIMESESEQSKHAIAVAAATAAAADAAVAAAHAAAAVVRLTSSGCAVGYGVHATEHWAATRIQTAFRGYLAKRALCALKSLVKLQALVRGHMVRKQTAETLRSMQALVRVQARIRARRVRMSEEGQAVQRQLLQRRQQEPNPRRSTTEGWNGSTYSMHQHEAKVQSRQAAVTKRERALTYSFSQQEMERRLDESAKIVEVDTCRPKSSSNRKKGSVSESETAEENIYSTTYSTIYAVYNPAVRSFQPTCSPPQIEGQFASPLVVSPVQSECVTASALQDFSPRTVSGKYGYAEDSTFSTAESSPQYYSAASKAEAKRGPFTPSKPEYETFFQDYAGFPNYMANTESSKAKLRSHSAPKQRPESPEKMLLMAKKRSSLPRAGENRMNFCGARMQRSSSHVGTTCKGFLHSGSIALDRSTMSLRDSECDTVSISNGDYRRSFLAMEGEQQKRPSPGKRR